MEYSIRSIAKSAFAGSFCLLSLIGSAQRLTPKSDPNKGTWGFVDANDKWVVKPKYTKAEPFRKMPDGRMASRVTDKEKTGYVDEAGKPIGAGISFLAIDSISP